MLKEMSMDLSGSISFFFFREPWNVWPQKKHVTIGSSVAGCVWGRRCGYAWDMNWIFLTHTVGLLRKMHFKEYVYDKKSLCVRGPIVARIRVHVL